MYWYEWLLPIFMWRVIGDLILVTARFGVCKGAINMADGWEFVNPIHIYKYNKVNWFGAIITRM